MAPKKKQATAKGKAAMEVDEEKEEEAAKPTAKQASDSQLIEMLQALRADMSKFGQELTRQGGPLDRIDQRLNRLERAQYAEPVGGARPSGVDAVAAAHLEPVAAAAADGPTVAWRVRGFPQRETRLHDIKVARGKEEREGLAGYWVWGGAGSGREGCQGARRCARAAERRLLPALLPRARARAPQTDALAHVIAALPTDRDENAAARACKRLRDAVQHRRAHLKRPALDPPADEGGPSGAAGKAPAKGRRKR